MHECEQDLKRNMIVSDFMQPHTPCIAEAKRLRYRSLRDGSDEVMEVVNNTVTVRSLPGHVHLFAVTASFPLIDAFWCDFPAGNPAASDKDMFGKCICMIGTRIVQFCPRQGSQIYALTLPFPVSRALASPFGLILEKEVNDSGSSKMFPHLFSLSHPYNELLPIVCKNKDDAKSCHYAFDETQVQAVHWLQDSRLVLCWSARHETHSLHVLRPVLKDEWKCAAANAESVLSSVSVSVASLSACSRALSGDSPICSPFMPTPRRPRMEWQPGRVVCTRSMTAAAACMQSTPASQGMHSRSLRETTLLRSRATLQTSPRLASLYDERSASVAIDAPGSEMDLIAPEVCLDCIWSEPQKRQGVELPSKEPASTAFFTTDVVGQTFACYYSSEWQAIKVVRVIAHSDNSLTAVRGLTTIKCSCAINLTGRHMMVVVERDRTVVLYTGLHRLGTLYVPIQLTTPTPEHSATNVAMCGPVLAVYPYRKGHFMLQTTNNSFHVCRVPSATRCAFVNRCVECVCAALPNDKALKIASSWTLENNWRLLKKCRGNRESLEMALFLHFLLNKCGITIASFHAFRQIERLKVQSCSARDAKKKRTVPADRLKAWQYVESLHNTKSASGGRFQVHLHAHAELFAHAGGVLAGLHSAYELAKTDNRLTIITPMLAAVLHTLASLLAIPAYQQYYEDDFAHLKGTAYLLSFAQTNDEFSSGVRRFSERVPSLHRSVLSLLEHQHIVALSCPASSLPVLVVVAVGLGIMRSSFDVQKALGKNWEKKMSLSKEQTQALVHALDRQTEVGSKCRRCAQVLRLDQHLLVKMAPSLALVICELVYDEHVLALNHFSPAPPIHPLRAMPSLYELETSTTLRWRQDIRFTNVAQMLDSSRPCFIPPCNGLTEQDQRDQQEQLLGVVAMRSVTQCFGRALLTVRHAQPCISLPLEVPELCLEGVLHPSNQPLYLPESETLKALLEYGCFYNGVAVGLSLGAQAACQLDGEWLLLCVSDKNACTSAGMMLAFGLNDHLCKMNLFTIHELLSAGDRLMSVAVLLGYSANLLGTSDRQMHKVLVTHLPFMMGPTLLELHIDPMVQTAALVGLGLLFANSANTAILSLLINEMGKPAAVDQEPWTDRYSYTLAVGFAVGLISLGKGDELATNVPYTQRYPSLLSRLLLMMEGGSRSLCVFPTNTPTDIVPPGGHDTAATHTAHVSNHVMEFDNVNPHLSSGAATVALGLMYLRTGNETVAAQLRAPNTLSKLEGIRPDLVLLRTVCQCLVLWEQITPTEAYVEGLVPSVVSQYVRRLFTEAPSPYGEDDAHLSTIVDLETIAQSYLNVVAGACFAIGIRYASSFSRRAFAIIMRYMHIVLPESRRTDANVRLCIAAGSTTCAAVLNQLLYSLALVMAGSGDLQVLRICRVLRKRILAQNAAKDVTLYSTQLAVNSALGLLVMGRGRYALAKSDVAIAALLMAFYPVTPHSVTDNRTYLQPVRFLWTLAAEERLLDVVDSSTELPLVDACIRIHFKRSTRHHFENVSMTTPALLPDLCFVDKVEVSCDCYQSRSFSLPAQLHELHTVLRGRHGSLPLARIGSVQRQQSTDSDEEDEDLTDVKGCELVVPLRSAVSVSPPKLWSMAVCDEVQRRVSNLHTMFGTSDALALMHNYVKDLLEQHPSTLPRMQARQMRAFLQRSQQQCTCVARHLATSLSTQRGMCNSSRLLD